MGDVGQSVSKATGGNQEPWVNFTGLSGRLYLKAAPGPAAPAPAPDDGAAQQLAALRLQLETLQRERAAPAPALAPPPTPPQGRARGFPVGIGGSFRDCADCPEMVVIPAGSFLMGTPPTEAGRGTDEGPQRQVTLRTPLALGRTHVTVAEYRAHVEATRRPDPPSCWAYDANQRWGDLPGHSWRNPGFPQTEADPVVCVGWAEATDYAEWLRRRTGKGYRLPTEAEWEYAARAGGTSPWWWGSDPAAVCTYANAGDRTLTGAFPLLVSWLNATCTDGFLYTSPVGRFPANGFGLFDMAGNATQWVADCYRNTYEGAPADAATPVRLAECDSRAHRGGGSWYSLATLRVGARGTLAGAHRRQENGLRVARTPDE
jgi:formylglycine-generating enzyme required for sulfatase activity